MLACVRASVRVRLRSQIVAIPDFILCSLLSLATPGRCTVLHVALTV